MLSAQMCCVCQCHKQKEYMSFWSMSAVVLVEMNAHTKIPAHRQKWLDRPPKKNRVKNVPFSQLFRVQLTHTSIQASLPTASRISVLFCILRKLMNRIVSLACALILSHPTTHTFITNWNHSRMIYINLKK